ncbi:MAG: tRNA (adenosine(37)-N6)-threonylcarbamoyltransferase complex dimerization subunit type 1 TsaB [Rhizomicrobium sp.]
MNKSDRLLAVDTALGACSVAVLDGERCLAHRFVEMARGHAEALAPMVQETVAASGICFAGFERLAVTTGPGTFTGQRVGLAFMRALRIALKKPLTGVTTLEAMAFAAAGSDGRAAAIHDARRGEAYLLLWDRGETVLAPTVMPFAEAIATVEAFGPATLCGTGALAAGKDLGSRFWMSAICQPDALWVARLALMRPATSEVPAPLYLRAPDAKLPDAASS